MNNDLELAITQYGIKATIDTLLTLLERRVTEKKLKGIKSALRAASWAYSKRYPTVTQ